jgi:hypothetical protein
MSNRISVLFFRGFVLGAFFEVYLFFENFLGWSLAVKATLRSALLGWGHHPNYVLQPLTMLLSESPVNTP